MLEKDIESALCRRVKSLGGLCEKFVSPGRRSVELKAPGKKPTPLQERDHEARRKLGCRVVVIDSMEGANAFSG